MKRGISQLEGIEYRGKTINGLTVGDILSVEEDDIPIRAEGIYGLMARVSWIQSTNSRPARPCVAVFKTDAPYTPVYAKACSMKVAEYPSQKARMLAGREEGEALIREYAAKTHWRQ